MNTLTNHLNDLSEIASNVLQTSAFACAFPGTPEEVGRIEQGLGSEIAFDGPISGKLQLAAPQTLVLQLAADILALEPDEVQADQAADVLHELSNIMCGQLATALCGITAVVRLSIPQPVEVTPQAWDQLVEQPGSVILMVDDFPLVVNLSWN